MPRWLMHHHLPIVVVCQSCTSSSTKAEQTSVTEPVIPMEIREWYSVSFIDPLLFWISIHQYAAVNLWSPSIVVTKDGSRRMDHEGCPSIFLLFIYNKHNIKILHTGPLQMEYALAWFLSYQYTCILREGKLWLRYTVKASSFSVDAVN